MKPIDAKHYKIVIIAVSIIIPAVVTSLYFIQINGTNFHFLPKLNAFINGTTFFLLIAAFIAIKFKKIRLHKFLMTASLVLSACFLTSYVLYHATTQETHYGGESSMKYLYFFILISHIVLSVVLVPMVLISYVRALSSLFDKHKKIARITLPIWLYVAATGVVVYLFISPYYPQ